MINKNALDWLRDDCDGGVSLSKFLEVYPAQDFRTLLLRKRIELRHPQYWWKTCQMISSICSTDQEYLDSLSLGWDVHYLDGKP